MANLVLGLVEALEQEQRLQIARNPTSRPAIVIRDEDIAAIIRPSGFPEYVIPIQKLIERLKEQTGGPHG